MPDELNPILLEGDIILEKCFQAGICLHLHHTVATPIAFREKYIFNMGVFQTILSLKGG